MERPDEYDFVETAQVKKLEQYAEDIVCLEQAIVDAKNNGSLEGEAIATECAALFYMDWEKEKIAAIYMQDAYDCYARLGAAEKLARLEELYPQYLAPVIPNKSEKEVNYFTEEFLATVSHDLQTTLTTQKIGEQNYFTDEFIATISHEFRTPLNGILGMSEALLEEVFGTMNAQQLNAVTTIDRSGCYLLALINNMVDLSKVQVGKLDLEISEVLVEDLCKSSINFVKHHAIQKKIELDIDFPSDAGYIAVDAQRMLQVLINLLNHSINCTPIGGRVKLIVSRNQKNTTIDHNSSIQFSIIDSSKEISTLEKDPSLSSPLNTSNQSIGFGLMLVNPIVQLHGGVLSCQSVIRQGTCFNVSLPHTCLIANNTVDEPDLFEDIAPRSGTIAKEIPRLPLILIVEDNELNANTMSSYLAAKGFRPIVANDGLSAINMTKQHIPDLILMDIQMPGMDGLEAITRIRQNPEQADIPIIALTALTMKGDREKCLAAGANEYIPKPVKLRQLKNVIQRFLLSKVENSSILSEFLV